MAVITDVGEEKDIHPKQKEPVGDRLALAALALAYGKEVVYTGPRLRQDDGGRQQGRPELRHVGGGLEAKERRR